MSSKFFDNYFDELRQRLRDADAETLDKLCQCFVDVRERNMKVVLVGNGGSAAIASHVAVDLTKVLGISAVNFNEADLITCLANDYGYENWVAKAIEYYAKAGDVAVLVSSSGQSRNIINGAKRARELGLQIVTFSGFKPDNPLRKFGDLNLWVNSSVYNIVESTHLTWLLAAVDRLAANGVRRGE